MIPLLPPPFLPQPVSSILPSFHFLTELTSLPPIPPSRRKILSVWSTPLVPPPPALFLTQVKDKAAHASKFSRGLNAQEQPRRGVCPSQKHAVA